MAWVTPLQWAELTQYPREDLNHLGLEVIGCGCGGYCPSGILLPHQGFREDNAGSTKDLTAVRMEVGMGSEENSRKLLDACMGVEGA